MLCYNCGCRLSEHDFCTSCGAEVGLYKKVMFLSNRFYNDGLEKAQIRDLTGAINSLRQSLILNKNNIVYCNFSIGYFSSVCLFCLIIVLFFIALNIVLILF